MKWKRADRESAKTLRKQAFLSRCKSEPDIVESFVFNVLPATSIASPVPGLWLKTENIQLFYIKKYLKIFFIFYFF